MEFINETENKVKAIVYAYAGSDNLRREMQKIKTDYVKVERGGKVSYILRGKDKKSPIYKRKLIIVL
jgi:hypothetical protein